LSFVAENRAERRAETLRWGICFTLVLVVHGAAALALLMQPSEALDFADAPVPVLMADDSALLGPLVLNDPTPPPPEEQTKPPEEQPKPPEEAAEIVLPLPEPPKVQEQPRTAPRSVEPQEAPPNTQRWQAMLAAHINNFKHYPQEARARAEEGVAKVAFTIDRDGRLLSSRIVQSSGSPTLDRETLDMLARAQPMPRPPEKVTEAQLSFTVPVRFTIR